MINGVNIDNQTPQIAFRARKINDIKKAHRIIDQINDATVEFIHKDRPIAEKSETMLRRYTAKFMEVFGKKTNKNNKLVETANKASREANLEELRRSDPENYKEALKVKKEELVMDAYNNAYEDFVLKRMMKEDPEKAKIIMRNRIIGSMNEAINDIFSPKNLIKMTFDVMTTELSIGLGKIIIKCDRALKKIPLVKEARDKKFAKYEQYINKALKDGVMDADQAGELLIKADPTIAKVK